MKCKSCKREIPDNSIFCNWCGTKQIKAPKTEIKVPRPRQLASGKWNIQLRIKDCPDQSITEDTPELCTAKAIAIKTGLLEAREKPSKTTLREAADNYIDKRKNVLSPSTVRGYNIIRDNRFRSLLRVLYD